MKFSTFPCIVTAIIAILLFSCGSDFTPRPHGFFRIDFPGKKYHVYKTNCPFTFEIPEYSLVFPHENAGSYPCWLDLMFPQFKGTLHLTYFDLASGETGNMSSVQKHIEDSRALAYKHIIKAQAIEERFVSNDSAGVHGIIYEIKGANTASSLQFFLTDSTRHFLRGALYFSVAPNNDSLTPVINFIRGDVEHFINTLGWVEGKK